MKVLVIGCGSVGKKHIKNLRSFFKGEIIAYRTKRDGSEELKRDFGVASYYDLSEALDKKPDAVIISNPASMHIPAALEAAKRGFGIFIEKPLSVSLNGIDELSGIVKKKGLVSMVGYNMRFHPVIKKAYELVRSGSIGNVMSFRADVGQYLPDWHPGTDYKKSCSAQKDLGGGVILELSHEIDYARWIFGNIKEVFCMSGNVLSLGIDVEGVAELLTKHDKSVLGSIHMDFVSRVPKRTLSVIGEEGLIFCDINENIIKLYKKNTGWQDINYSGYDRNDMYVEEMKHFIACVEGKEKPLVNISEGIKTLKVALAAKESSENGKVVVI